MNGKLLFPWEGGKSFFSFRIAVSSNMQGQPDAVITYLKVSKSTFLHYFKAVTGGL